MARFRKTHTGFCICVWGPALPVCPSLQETTVAVRIVLVPFPEHTTHMALILDPSVSSTSLWLIYRQAQAILDNSSVEYPSLG